MKTEVRIADFKAHLSEYLRTVRSGQELVIKDRDTPIARVVPHEPASEPFVTRKPTRSFRELDALPGVRVRSLTAQRIDDVLRETRQDWYDKWLAQKRSSTRR